MTGPGPSVLPAPAVPDAAVRATVRRRLLAPASAVLAGVTVVVGALDLTRTSVPMVVQLVPFAVSVLVLGLPHGALDHLVPARMGGTRTTLRSVLLVVGVYVVLGLATALVWTAAPLAGFALFIALTWFHWGQGDLWVLRTLTRPGDRARGAVLTAVLRGALPMVVPFVAHPTDYAAVLRGTTGLVHGVDPTVVAAVFAPAVRIAVALGLAALVAAVLLVRVRGGAGPTGRAAEAGETLLLVAYFVVVPPVLAVGLYFCLWHSLRHVMRLELLDPRSVADLRAGRVGRPLLRFARDAAPVTVIAVAMLVVLAIALAGRGPLLAVYLVLISALTVPHVAVVTWMDRRDRCRAVALDGGRPAPVAGTGRPVLLSTGLSRRARG